MQREIPGMSHNFNHLILKLNESSVNNVSPSIVTLRPILDIQGIVLSMTLRRVILNPIPCILNIGLSVTILGLTIFRELSFNFKNRVLILWLMAGKSRCKRDISEIAILVFY